MNLGSEVFKYIFFVAALMAATGITASKPEVRMADKIAMRSLVLSKNMPRIGGNGSFINYITQRGGRSVPCHYIRNRV